MTRFLLILSIVALCGPSVSAQESRTTLQSLSPEEAKLVMMSDECAQFEARLTMLKESCKARENARVVAYHQQLLDAMRVEINQAMEAGDAQKNTLETLTQIVHALEGKTFDLSKPQETEALFAQLDKFLAVMKDALPAEIEKSSNGIRKQ